eukprot:GHUV01032477.1.p1 GENE.GHUV01032477.1~~GHUV01032477.1.p1  ORF type:complete len:111 (+),score=4.19 GHUV01032477.1:520-852(+)
MQQPMARLQGLTCLSYTTARRDCEDTLGPVSDCDWSKVSDRGHRWSSLGISCWLALGVETRDRVWPGQDTQQRTSATLQGLHHAAKGAFLSMVQQAVLCRKSASARNATA